MSTSDQSTILRIQGRVQTTDATVTTCGYYTLPDECVAFVRAVVLAVQSGSANTAGYERKAIVEGQSGTRALVGAVESGFAADREDVGTWDCTIDVSGNDVRVRVTGIAATTIDWQTTLEIILFKP